MIHMRSWPQSQRLKWSCPISPPLLSLEHTLLLEYTDTFSIKSKLFFCCLFFKPCTKNCHWWTPENIFSPYPNWKGTVIIVSISTAPVERQNPPSLNSLLQSLCLGLFGCLGSFFLLSSDWQILYFLILIPPSLTKINGIFNYKWVRFLGLFRTLHWNGSSQRSNAWATVLRAKVLGLDYE